MNALKQSNTQLQQNLNDELAKVFSEHDRETLASAVEACIKEHVNNWYPDRISDQQAAFNDKFLSLALSFIDEDVRKFFVRGHAWGKRTAKLVDELRVRDPAIYHISQIQELDVDHFRSILIKNCAYLKPTSSRFPKKFMPVWDAARAEYRESVKDLPLSSPEEQHASLQKEVDRIETELETHDTTDAQYLKLVNMKLKIIQTMNKLSPQTDKQPINQLESIESTFVAILERLPISTDKNRTDNNINALVEEVLGLIKSAETQHTKVIPQITSESKGSG